MLIKSFVLGTWIYEEKFYFEIFSEGIFDGKMFENWRNEDGNDIVTEMVKNKGERRISWEKIVDRGKGENWLVEWQQLWAV